MKRQRQKKSNLLLPLLLAGIVALLVGALVLFNPFANKVADKSINQETTQVLSTQKKINPEEQRYLTEKFTSLSKINSETIGYLYLPGTKLDEPIVQTTDNETYLDKTFEGDYQPLMGAVFMDTDNDKSFSDRLTWLFGHARGSLTPDNRMFNDVNFYDEQSYFDEHPYAVVETPNGKLYYEAAFFIIVHETTSFYKTHFNSAEEFVTQLTEVKKDAKTSNPNVKINPTDNYLVLSTCREEDPDIRANLYMRQLSDKEVEELVKTKADFLKYKPTRQ